MRAVESQRTPRTGDCRAAEAMHGQANGGSAISDQIKITIRFLFLTLLLGGSITRRSRIVAVGER